MANALYPLWKAGLLSGHPSANLNASVVRVALVDTGAYTYSASHWLFSNVSSAVVGTPANLTSKTFTSGTFDAANVSFSSLSGSTVEALVIYVDTGDAATSNLVAFIDSSVTGLPLTPDGGTVNLNWNANGIFTL